MMKEKFIEAENKYRDIVEQDKWRLSYHLMPPVGWLNDPNGLCVFNGIYHIFYQYSPESAYGKNKGWGHYSTKDFLTFVKEENPLYPDSEIDRDGAYSGSAIVDDGMIHFFYTGNIKFNGNYDYINEGRGHYVNYFSSKDGFTFTSKECLLKNKDYPSDMSCHVRDPKIYKKNSKYYMVLGARTKDSIGCILIYQSTDLKRWNYKTRVTTPKKFGYMWECPDLFDMDNQKVLIVCPQGVERENYKYENVYQNGYFLVNGEIEDQLTLSEFNELDKGFDFYAPQTFQDEKGRRILIGWMGLPDIPYTNPTIENKWQHALTLPRELTLKNNKIYQYPINETNNLRINHEHKQLLENEIYYYKTHSCQIHLEPKEQQFQIDLRKDVQLFYNGKIFKLSLKESGFGRDERHLIIEQIVTLDIYSDTSSLEIFINQGECAMTTRVYDSNEDTYIKVSCKMAMDYYEMKSYKIINHEKM